MASTIAQPVPATATMAANSDISSSSAISTQNLHHLSHLTSNTNSNSFNPKKRTLDHVSHFQSSPYFKMRAILKDLRPLFLQVLRAPDIQKCEAGLGIQEKMKVMVDLCRQKTVENVPLVKCNNNRVGSEDVGSEKPVLMSRDMKPRDEPPQANRSSVRQAEEKRFPTGNNFEKQTPESNRIPRTYIVGGSAFGWNFITFHGSRPEYYGRTKEAFRAGK